MPNFNVADAKRTPQIVIRDAKGDVLSVVTPKDFQVGFEGSPGALILKGALDISATTILVATSNETNVKISNDIVAAFIKNTSGLPVTVLLPTPPGNLGQTHIVKDFQGTASATVPIVVTTTDGSTIDGQSNMAIQVNFGAIMFVWMGGAWVSLALGASGAGAGATAAAKFVVWDTEPSLTNSRKLTVVSGELTLDTTNPNAELGLPELGTPGSYPTPSSITTDAQGRVTAVGPPSAAGADREASYVVMALTASLPNERQLAVLPGIKLTDGGPNGNATLAIDDRIVATISGSTFSGTVNFLSGVSGSMQRTTAGQSYLVAGSGISIITQSNGQILFAVSGSVASSDADFVIGATKLYTTSSVAFTRDALFADSYGVDNFFYVSGTTSLRGANAKRAVFGGDVVVSGGLSGSLQQLANGLSYLVAGPGILITTQANGQIFITSSGTPGGSGVLSGSDADFFIGNNELYSTSSIFFGSGANFTRQFGYDVRYYFSGTRDPNLVGDPRGGVTVFGGDVVFSSSQFFHTSALWIRVTKDSSNVSHYQFLSRSTVMTASLFEVTDETSGSLFSVSDFSTGIPVMDLFSDHRIFMSGTLFFGSGTSTTVNPRYVFFSGTRGITGSTEKVVVFDGDVRVSGTLLLGPSGSHRISVTGSDMWFYDVSNPNGWTLTQLAQSGSGGGSSGPDADFVIGADRIRTTSSVAIGSGSNFAQDYGTDVFFYVSGTTGLRGSTAKRSVFGGDVVVSGGLSGSLQQISNGLSYLMAGANITITTQSNGQIVIASTATGGGTVTFGTSSVDARVYYGYSTGSLLWDRTVWTDFTSSMSGNYVDVYQVGISRSNSTFTVDTTGYYNFHAFFNSIGSGEYLGFRLSGSSGTLLQRTTYHDTSAPVGTQAPAVFDGIVQLNSGSSFKLQYAVKAGSAFTWTPQNPLDGENMRTGEISIFLIPQPLVVTTINSNTFVTGGNRMDIADDDIIVWRLNELSGNFILNYGSSGSAGHITGSSQLVYGRAGAYDVAVDFRGYNTPTYASGSSIRPKDFDINVSAWIHPYQFMSGVVVMKNLTTGNYDPLSPIILGVTGSYGSPFVQLRTTVSTSNLTVIDFSRSLAVYAWNHFGFSLSGSGTSMVGRFYVNGDFVRSMVLTGALDYGSGSGWWAVGGLPIAGAEAGDYKLNEIRVANSVRTDQWWRDVYIRGMRGTVSGAQGSGQAYVTGTWRDAVNTFITTGSVSIDGQNRQASQIGSDVFFFVSGNLGLSGTSAGRIAAFGGDVKITGTLAIGTGSTYIDSNEFRWDANTKITKVGADLRFSDSTNPSGFTLTQLAQSGSTSSGAGSGFVQGFQQANYAFVTQSAEWNIPTSSVFVGAPGLTASITTAGSPIFIAVNANYAAISGTPTGIFSLARNGVNLGHSTWGMQVAGVMVNGYNNNVSIVYVDFLPSGTYTYSFIGCNPTGSGRLTAQGIGPASIMAFEMIGANVVTASTMTAVAVPGGIVTGLTATITPVAGPILAIVNSNYSNNGASDWAHSTIFRGSTQLGAGSLPALGVTVGTNAGEMQNASVMILDQGATNGASTTYSYRATNGAGTGVISKNNQFATIILWELNDVNFKNVTTTTNVALGAGYTDIASSSPTVALKTRGRPVFMGSCINSNTTAAGGRSGFSFLRGGSALVTGSKGMQVIDGEGNNGWNKMATMFWLDTNLAAGGYSYQIAGLNVSGSNTTAEGTLTTFFVYELDAGKEVVSGPWIDAGSKIKTTSSVAISDGENIYADQKGADVFLYVSGSIGITGSIAKIALFGGDLRVSGSVQFLGGMIYNSIIVTGSYVIQRDDYIIGVNQPANSSSIIFTPIGALTGRAYKIMDVGGNAASGSIIVSGSAGELVAGASTYPIAINRASIEIIKLAGNWSIG